MHLQQTKNASRETGGPQYYFHDLAAPVKELLRSKGALAVVLQTPYGIAASPFMAVGKDHKLSAAGRAVAGKVGHDRIQQGRGEQSIGEAIRYWYGLKSSGDFERIDVEVSIHPDGHFILIPLSAAMRGGRRRVVLERNHAPLSFHRDYQSKLWREQIDRKRKQSAADVTWAAAQMAAVVADHLETSARNILEADLLRASGALSLLGLELGAYLGKGYDCLSSKVQLSDWPIYPCPVEIKKRSKDFSYQVTRYTELPRAIVLCMKHDIVNPPLHIDFIELPVIADYLVQK